MNQVRFATGNAASSRRNGFGKRSLEVGVSCTRRQQQCSCSGSSKKGMLRSTAPQRRPESAVPIIGGGNGGGGSSGNNRAETSGNSSAPGADSEDEGRSRVLLFNLEITPDVCAIALVYFVQVRKRWCVCAITLGVAECVRRGLSL